MKSWRIWILVLGVILAVIGHFLDKATNFPWIVKAISSDSANGLKALDKLREDNRIGITPKHPGFSMLLKLWPNLDDKNQVKIIGRGGARLILEPWAKADFDLIAYDRNENIIEPKWKESIARQILIEEQKSLLFKLGELIFFIGITITLVSGFLEFQKSRLKK
jgi:hypothetical protein